MRILKILLVIIAIYFIRRFIQMYRVMKNIQEQQELLRRQQQQNPQNGHTEKSQKKGEVIDADFKVMD